MENKGKGISVASLVLAIIGVVLAFIPIVNTVGIILGALALIFGIIGIATASRKVKAIVGTILAIPNHLNPNQPERAVFRRLSAH